MMTLIDTRTTAHPATPVLNTVITLNNLADRVISLRACVVAPLTMALSKSASLGASMIAGALPVAASRLNQWAGQTVISARRVEQVQRLLETPNQHLNYALQNYLEPNLGRLGNALLEKKTASPGDDYREFLHPERAHQVLSRPHMRALLSQLYTRPKPPEVTLESEIQRALSLMVSLSGGGGEVQHWQMDKKVFRKLLAILRREGVLTWGKRTAQRQREWSTYAYGKVQQFLRDYYACTCSQLVSSEMLVQLSGVPARLQSELFSLVRQQMQPVAAEPPETAIHLPRAGTLRTLASGYGDVQLSARQSMVVSVAECPAQRQLNATTQFHGLSLAGVGGADTQVMALYINNNRSTPLQVNLHSRQPVTSYTTFLRPGPWRALADQSTITTATAGKAATCPALYQPIAAGLSVPSIGLLAPFNQLDQLLTRAINFFSVEGAGLGGSPGKRDVSNQRYPVLTSNNPLQYDRLTDVPVVSTTAASAIVTVKTASYACNLWQNILAQASPDDVEAGFARYLALSDQHVALREIGKDPEFQEDVVRSPANRLKILLLSMEKLITRPDDDAPFRLDQDEFTFLQNDQRCAWNVGLAVLSGGESHANLRMLGKMLLPQIERCLKAQTPLPAFAGFAALNRKIIAGLSEATLPTITVKAFASLVADKTQAFCNELAQRYNAFSSLDLARLRLLLDEQNREAFPVLDFSSHPQIQHMACFSEDGICLALAATVVAEDRRMTIPLITAKRIGLHYLLFQHPVTLTTLLGQTTRVGTHAKAQLKNWWQEESQTFTDVLEFTRARLALDKMLLQPKNITATALITAQAAVHAALTQFYQHQFLALPQAMQEGLVKNYPQPLPVTFIQVSRPEETSPDKPCLGIIIQQGGHAWMVTPLPKIGDPTRRAIFDVSNLDKGSGFHTAVQKQALTNILFEKSLPALRRELVLTTQLLRFSRGSGHLWHQNLAEKVVTKIEQLSNPPVVTTTTASVASADPVLDVLWNHARSIIFQSPWGECADEFDNLFIHPDKESFLEKLGTGFLCMEELTPEGEVANEFVKIAEPLTQQVYRWVKSGKAARRQVTPAENPAQQDDDFIKWQDEEITRFTATSANLANIYQHRELSQWLAPLRQPSWEPLSKATFLPAPDSKSMLDELAGYANYQSTEAGKVYLNWQYGDAELQYEVVSTSLSASGEKRYLIPAGAPADRQVTVIKDQHGRLQVVANNLFKLVPLSANATGSNHCGLYVPQGMTLIRVLGSVYNDNRLVIEVEDQDKNRYLRELCASREFIPFEPGVFIHAPYRMGRGITDDSDPFYRGRYGLAIINDKQRQSWLTKLFEARKKLLSFKTEKQLMVDIVWLANEVKKLAGHKAMAAYVDSLPESDIAYQGFQALKNVVDDIARGTLNFISPRLSAGAPDYHLRLQQLTEAEQGLENIIKVFKLPGSDHTLTQEDIATFGKRVKELISTGDVYKIKLLAFRASVEFYNEAVNQYIDRYRDKIFKSSWFSNFFRYPLEEAEEINGIRYVAVGREIGKKFPQLEKDILQARNLQRLASKKIDEAMRQNPLYVSQQLKTFFNLREDYPLNTAVFEKIRKKYQSIVERSTLKHAGVFKDYEARHPVTGKKERISMPAAMERLVLAFTGIDGQTTSGEDELKFGISCNAQADISKVSAIKMHESLHPTIAGVIKEEALIDGEAYIGFPDAITTLTAPEQMDLLHKIMSAPAVFRTYINGQEGFNNAFFKACTFSSHEEMARLARELQANWQYPFPAPEQEKADRIIDILFAIPQLKLDMSIYFPDCNLAIFEWLERNVPQEIADRVTAEWVAENE